MAFSISKPFRKPFYTNIFFTVNIVLIWLLNTLIIWVKQLRLPQLEFYDDMPALWFAFIVIYAHIWTLIFYIYENLFCVKLFIWYHHMKQYTQIQEF